MHSRAQELIAELRLSPHPEGGYFREIHRAAANVDPLDGRSLRSAVTAIYFLLTANEVSRWHRVASDEIWHFLEGDALELHEADARFDRAEVKSLGPFGNGAEPVRVITAGSWQAARSLGEYTLVACCVGPGFDFTDFELLRDLPEEADLLKIRHPLLAAFV